jgi:hypothetical protein
VNIANQVKAAGGLSAECVNALRLVGTGFAALLALALFESSFRLAIAANGIAAFGFSIVWQTHVAQKSWALRLAKSIEDSDSSAQD